jgi:hypothetical protein
MNSSPENAFVVTEEELATAAEFSEVNGSFLDFITAHPEALDRSSFTQVLTLEEEVRYRLQPWPFFIDRSLLTRLGDLNWQLCKLIKEIPHRLFGRDASALAEFYGLNQSLSRLVAAGLDVNQWSEGVWGRSDLLFTSQGFRCLEFNIVGALGGWESAYVAESCLQVPLVAKFLRQEGLEGRYTDTLSRMLISIIKQAVSKFSSHEINIAMAFDPEYGELGDSTHMRFGRPRYKDILAQLPVISGDLFECALPELEERGNKLFLGQTRIHAVIEAHAGWSGEAAARAWVRGGVLLFNGPFTVIYTDKRNLALLSELTESSLFNAAEKKILRQLVPWTRRTSSVRLHAEAAAPPTVEEVRNQRQALVLKPKMGKSGAGVQVGAFVEPAVWERLVDAAFEAGDWVVQERLVSRPHRFQCGEQGSAPHDVVWSFFTFGREYGGSELRMVQQGTTGVISASMGSVLGGIFEVGSRESKDLKARS